MTDTAPNFVDWLNARFIQQGAEVEFRHDGHSIAAHGFGVALGSAFQPIIGAVSGRTLGWEGLVRPRNLAGQAPPVGGGRRGLVPPHLGGGARASSWRNSRRPWNWPPTQRSAAAASTPSGAPPEPM